MMCQRECLAGETCDQARRKWGLCTCECPECGDIQRFLVEADVTAPSAIDPPSAYESFEIVCHSCGAEIGLDIEIRVAWSEPCGPPEREVI